MVTPILGYVVGYACFRQWCEIMHKSTPESPTFHVQEVVRGRAQAETMIFSDKYRISSLEAGPGFHYLSDVVVTFPCL